MPSPTISSVTASSISTTWRDRDGKEHGRGGAGGFRAGSRSGRACCSRATRSRRGRCWEQEQRIIGFARGGQGHLHAAGAGQGCRAVDGLSDEQKAAVRHVWDSTDQVMLIRGGAGTGKTTMMTPALAKLGVPVVLLAPSADASRDQLRQGRLCTDANTVAAFLGEQGDAGDSYAAAASSGWMRPGCWRSTIWTGSARWRSRWMPGSCCRAIPSSIRRSDRHGNMLTVLEEYAGLPVAKLTKIQRQKGDYAGAVAAIRDGELETGDAVLRKLGWVVEGKGHDALVAEYAKAIEERKADGEQKTVLVIDPTHKDGDVLTEKLRAVRKDKGLITRRGESLSQPDGRWAGRMRKRATPASYGGDEVIQFFRNSGRFKAGDRVKASELLPQLAKVKPEHFAVYRRGRGQVLPWATRCASPATAGTSPASTASIMAGSTQSRLHAGGRYRALQRLGGWQRFRSYQAWAGANQPGDAKQDG